MHYGFVGLGNLGGHMAENIIKAGFQLSVYDLDKKLAERHIARGAKSVSYTHLTLPTNREV